MDMYITISSSDRYDDDHKQFYKQSWAHFWLTYVRSDERSVDTVAK